MLLLRRAGAAAPLSDAQAKAAGAMKSCDLRIKVPWWRAGESPAPERACQPRDASSTVGERRTTRSKRGQCCCNSKCPHPESKLFSPFVLAMQQSCMQAGLTQPASHVSHRNSLSMPRRALAGAIQYSLERHSGRRPLRHPAVAAKAPNFNPQNTPNPMVGRDAAQQVVPRLTGVSLESAGNASTGVVGSAGCGGTA